MQAPRDDDELEERLSRPTPAIVDALRRLPGDVIVLGAGGKMGPSLTRMVRRAVDAIGDVQLAKCSSTGGFVTRSSIITPMYAWSRRSTKSASPRAI